MRRSPVPATIDRAAASVAVAALGLVALACGSASDVDNAPPEAALRVSPEIVLVGEAALLDASESVDPDGFVVEYRFQFTDGTPEIRSANPLLEHSFPRGGYYQIAVIAVDDRGGEGRADATITAVEDPGPPPPCPAPLTRCRGECVDLATDERHCGGCEQPCDVGEVCQAQICVASLEPGTILVQGPSPFGPGLGCTGLTAENDERFWALIGLDEIHAFHPVSLTIEASFPIAQAATRRGFGLAIDQSDTYLLTASVPVGSPMSPPELDVYDTNGVLLSTFDDVGGGVSVVGDHIYIYENFSQLLATYDGTGMPTAAVPLVGAPTLTPIFTDLAIVPDSPPQFGWLARPNIGPLDALLIRFDILSGEVLQVVDLPDPQGVGGVVVHGGVLWAMGAGNFYQIVP